MVVKDIEKPEYEYYGRHHYMVIPDLLCTYYENREFELVCYLSETHLPEFGESEFYHMMSFMELGFYEQAIRIYKNHRGDWFQRFQQLRIYWKHVVLFALYFRELDIPENSMEIIEEHYDSDLVRLLDYITDNREDDIEKNPFFQNLAQMYPVLGFSWAKHRDENKKTVLSFEDIQWKIWEKENRQFGNGNQFGIEKIFEDEDVSIYSYKPKLAAASMHIIKDTDTVIMLDCGCETKGEDTVRIPVKDILDDLAIGHVDAVFLSHAHMDHYGSLHEIRRFDVYMTRETMQLIRCISPETYLGNISFLHTFETKTVDDVSVRFIPNGHIKGSVLMDIDWKNKKRIVYTGDFSVEAQQTVDGFDVEHLLDDRPKRIDILITETTYGNKKDMYGHKQYEKMFLSLCEKYLTYGNKIFIPCFAIGQAQEAALLLSKSAETHGWKILIDGMAARVTELYQTLTDREEKILNKNISVCYSELEYRERIETHEIILASSGMLKPGGTSARYISDFINQKKACFIKIGFIHESEHLLQSILNRKNGNLHFVDLSLSAHAGYADLVHVIERLSPDHVIYVHGPGIA